MHDEIGVAQAPVLLRIAEIAAREIVHPIAFHHRVFLHRHEAIRLRDEAPPQRMIDLGYEIVARASS